jgi:hypothetical protein
LQERLLLLINSRKLAKILFIKKAERCFSTFGLFKKVLCTKRYFLGFSFFLVQQRALLVQALLVF